MSNKPLGVKSYGSIAHLPSSRLGPGDHCCHEGQARIATIKTRDKHDLVIVQEKLDGSNVGVARVGDVIYPLTRAGYIANTSPYEQHHKFHGWVYRNWNRFMVLLKDGERLCGEWLLQAHGTRYQLPHEPFVGFDLMRGAERALYSELRERLEAIDLESPHLVYIGQPAISIEQVMKRLGAYGYHGALDPIEGAVWRVERSGKVDFLAKYVRPDKVDGSYLPEVSGASPVWNKYKESAL
jgi:hypothetical protein